MQRRIDSNSSFLGPGDLLQAPLQVVGLKPGLAEKKMLDSISRPPGFTPFPNERHRSEIIGPEPLFTGSPDIQSAGKRKKLPPSECRWSYYLSQFSDRRVKGF
jgi:hypothetical protein